MADRDDDHNTSHRTAYTHEQNSIAWFVGVVVGLTLLAIAYLVFSANTPPPAPAKSASAPAVGTVQAS